jgi:hypothetical protein
VAVERDKGRRDVQNVLEHERRRRGVPAKPNNRFYQQTDEVTVVD